MGKKEKSKINQIVNIESYITKDNVEIRNTEGYFTERLYFQDMYDDKKFNKFIKNIETQIRTSEEYKSWVGDLHASGLDRCAILGNVTIGEKTKIELHHYPFTLYDIVYLCILRHLELGDKFDSTMIVDEIIDDHSQKNICVVPLCVTVHKLVHLGLIFVPLTSVYGNLNNFLEKYGKYMNDFMIDNYNTIYENTINKTKYSETDILKLANDYLKK